MKKILILLISSMLLLVSCSGQYVKANPTEVQSNQEIIHVELASLDIQKINFDTICWGEDNKGTIYRWDGTLSWAWESGERYTISEKDGAVEYRYDVPIMNYQLIEEIIYYVKFKMSNATDYSCKLKFDEKFNINYSNQTNEIIIIHERYDGECYRKETGIFYCNSKDESDPNDLIKYVVDRAFRGKP